MKEKTKETNLSLEKLKNDRNHYYFDENEMNEVGYKLLGNDKNVEAIEVFKINTELFPKSWNVYDSYGEALLKNGQKDEAIKMYKKSIELNPDNEGGKKVLQEQLKN